MAEENKEQQQQAATEQQQGEKKPEAKGGKIELDAAEYAKRLDDAKAAARAEIEEERKKERDAAAAEEARKKGEFEKLYQAETGRVKELEASLAATKLEARKQAVALKLGRHLSANHKDYVENDVDILPHVEFDADTPDDEVDKRIKAAADAFVKRTPKASMIAGAPAGASRGKLPTGTNPPPREDDRQSITRPVGPAARF
jgi:hypothetical protein